MTPSELAREVGRRRRSLGWSLAELARRAGTSAPTVHRYENGWRRFELYTLEKLAAALGCRLELRLVAVERKGRNCRTGARHAAAQVRRLFWDHRLGPSDLEQFPEWVAQRVLEFGALDDIAALQAYLGPDRLLEIVERVHFSCRRTRSFWEGILRQEGRSCTRRFSREEAYSSWTL